MRKWYRKALQSLESIELFFDNSSQKIFKRKEISGILDERRKLWDLDDGVKVFGFLDFLIEETELRKVQLAFPSRRETRFVWGMCSPFKLALSLKKGLYLCHHSAMFLHRLVQECPNDIYVNLEQPRRSTRGELTQEKIDVALSRKVRVTRNKAQYMDKMIWILNGMNTDNYGVIECQGDINEQLRLTNVERTLIDISIRPVYSGGVSSVLEAYKLAKDKISIEILAEVLQVMNYIYPYHQVVGFYLDKAGVYSKRQVEMLLKFDRQYDFYLTHQMNETAYSDKWRLHYPSNIDQLSFD